MVTAFKVEASLFDDYVDGGGMASSSSGDGVKNLKSEHDETKNDVLTLKRRSHHELSNTFACSSLESSKKSIKLEEDGLSSAPNKPYSSAGYELLRN